MSYEPPQPQAGQLQLTVERFINNVLTQLGNLDNTPVETYLEMLTTNPIAGMAFQAKVLLGLQMLGEYHHDDEKIQAFIRKNFEQMKGSLVFAVSEMWLASAIGYSFSEISVRTGRDWMLESILAVDPRRYRFEGTTGEIKDILYYSLSIKGNIPIPYEKGIHIVNQPYLAIGRDPYGIAEAKRAVPAWEAWKIIVACMVKFGQRQATPLLVAKVPTNESIVLYGPDGISPLIDPTTGQEVRIPIADAMAEQIAAAENGSAIITDLQNEIKAVSQEGRASEFFFECLRYLERIMLMAFLMPETTVSTGGAGGTGDSNLNQGHRQILDFFISSFMDQIKEGLLERVVRPLIEWNFVKQPDNYGEFKVPETDVEDRITLLDSLSNAVLRGAFSNQDLEVINRMRELARIPPLTQIVQTIAPVAAEQSNGNGNGQQEASNSNGKVPVNAKG